MGKEKTTWKKTSYTEDGNIKGQLISKCPFGVFKSPKKPTKFFFQDFCPSL